MNASAADMIEAELSKAKAQLAHLQKQKGGNHNADDAAARGNTPSSSSSNAAAQLLFMRAREAEDQIDFICLNRHVIQLVAGSNLANNDSSGDDDGDGDDGANSSTLAKSTEMCTALGLMLLQHNNNNNINHGDGIVSSHHHHHNGKSSQLHAALVQWYNSLHESTRKMALNDFQTQLTHQIAPEYPSNERSSSLIAEALSLSSLSFSNNDNSPTSSALMHKSWNFTAKCLVELQVIYDALQLQSQIIDQQQQQQQQQPDEEEPSTTTHNPYQLPESWRLDIVDELCKPLAERLRFHFLEEQTGIMTGGGGGGGGTGDDNNEAVQHHHQQQTTTASKMDRLPEWLFRYLREVVENHGVHSLVLVEGVQPLMDSMIDSLMVRASMQQLDDKNKGGVFGGWNDNDDGGDDYIKQDHEEGLFDNSMEPPECATTSGSTSSTMVHALLQRLKEQYYSHSSTYFLREVARMARHTLRAKSFFHHPDVVGSECRDRTIALRGIEQLFLFDLFLEQRVKEGGEGEQYWWCMNNNSVINFLPPRMVDTFLSSNEFLLKWWLEEERDGILSSLHQCASTTLSSYQHNNEEEGPVQEMKDTNSSRTNQQQQQQQQHLYPPISELFVALLHSARSKSNTFFDHRSRQMYIANVIAPLCSEYLDMVHAEAAWLRKRLLARPHTTSSSSSSVSVLRSANLPSDEMLTSNTMEWASLVTGTHLTAQAVLHSARGNNQHDDEEHPHKGDNSHDVLDRVGVAMERLCEAMVEDFTSAFVETIIMERAKLASYMMRAPFLLSEPPHNSPGRRGQRDKDKSVGSSLSLSPDLNDSVHVVSVGVQACHATMRKLRDMFQSDETAIDSGIGSSGVDPSTILYFGSKSIQEALKFAISQKLLDIAIDPQGMTPEIYLDGAQQFQLDVMAFERLFRARSATNNIEHGPMERVVTSSRLMSLESSQIQTIREALKALVVPSSGIGSLFGRRGDEPMTGEFAVGDDIVVHRLNVDDFYSDERLMEEATSMLEAKGFGALSLDEALSIINRRC